MALGLGPTAQEAQISRGNLGSAAGKEKVVRKGAFEVNSVCAIWLPVLGEILSLPSKTVVSGPASSPVSLCCTPHYTHYSAKKQCLSLTSPLGPHGSLCLKCSLFGQLLFLSPILAHCSTRQSDFPRTTCLKLPPPPFWFVFHHHLTSVVCFLSYRMSTWPPSSPFLTGT